MTLMRACCTVLAVVIETNVAFCQLTKLLMTISKVGVVCRNSEIQINFQK